MSGAALTANMDRKVRQAVNDTRKEGEEVRYKAQPVRLMANSTVQEVIGNLDKAERREEPLETVETNNRKRKASYLESFDIKKMRDFYEVIDEGERIKAEEAFQAISKEKKLKEVEEEERIVAEEEDTLVLAEQRANQVNTRKEELLSEENDNSVYVPPARSSLAGKWTADKKEQSPNGRLFMVTHFKPAGQVTRHAKVDYFVAMLPEGATKSVLIHQLFKTKGRLQFVLFQPIRSNLFLFYQRLIRIYELVRQEQTKKLMSGAKWTSSTVIQRIRDIILIGSNNKMWQYVVRIDLTGYTF